MGSMTRNLHLLAVMPCAKQGKWRKRDKDVIQELEYFDAQMSDNLNLDSHIMRCNTRSTLVTALRLPNATSRRLHHTHNSMRKSWVK